MLLLSCVVLAAPTPEEAALVAALADRAGEVVRVLEATGDPTLRWLAGRYAIAHDPRAAARLLGGDHVGNTWARVDLQALTDEPGAASAALAAMDAALAGENRAALAKQLVDWARERAPTDPRNAAALLDVAIDLHPPSASEAEQVLFRLPPEHSSFDDARRRLHLEPGHGGARLRYALGLGEAGLEALEALVAEGQAADALAAAQALTRLRAPPERVAEALTALRRRFPEDKTVAPLRLSLVDRVAYQDPPLAVRMYLALEPDLGVVAFARAAAVTEDPDEAVRLWREVARREGASSLAEEAKEGVRAALVQKVEAAADRVAAARAALDTPEGAGHPPLLRLALPDGEGRRAALAALVARFGEPEACEELARLLVAEGVGRAEAEALDGRCAGGAVERSLLRAFVAGETVLGVRPELGRLLVTAAGDVQVTQHAVDAEMLFRSSAGHPLDHVLDAWLLTPDLAWTVPAPPDAVATHTILPRGAPLAALTVRVGDERATALVVAEPLEVQTVAGGGAVAVAVLRAGQPVAGAEVLVRDAEGTRRARTGTDGIARVDDLAGTATVLARRGRALGFGVVEVGPAFTPPPRLTAFLHDRAVDELGRVVTLDVLGDDGVYPLVSRSAGGQTLGQQEVRVVGGAARVAVYAVGGGRISVGPEEHPVPLAASGSRDVKLRWSRVGDVARLEAWDPAPPHGGRVATLRVTAGWMSHEARVFLTRDPVRVEVPLHLAAGGDRLEAEVRIGEARLGAGYVVEAAPGPGLPVLGGPARAGKPLPLSVAGADLVLVTNGTATRWLRPGEVVLPAGAWSVAGWRNGAGPALDVVVDEPIPVERATLLARLGHTLEAPVVLRPGAVPPDEPAGLDPRARILADQRVLPIAALPPLELTLTGDPASGLQIAGAPRGSRIWGSLRDASDTPPLVTPVDLAGQRIALDGAAGVPWEALLRAGEPIAQALLAEEERLAEAQKVQRLDYAEMDASEEEAFGDAFGLGGIGTGGGGAGSSGYGRGGGSFRSQGVIVPRGLAASAQALGTWEGLVGDPARFTLPAWVAAADLELYVRAPDGRWGSVSRRFPLEGRERVPEAATVQSPTAWDGDRAALVALARSLPAAERALALAALRDVAPADWTVAWEGAAALPEPAVALAGHLGGVVPRYEATPSVLAEPLRAARVEEALLATVADPERARAIATRLTGDERSWVRGRAALALWALGDEEEARQVTLDASEAAVTLLLAGTGDRDRAWALARHPRAHPLDRAVAIAALAASPGPTSPLPLTTTAGVATLEAFVQGVVPTWRGLSLGQPAAAWPAGRAIPGGWRATLWVTVPAGVEPRRLRCGDGEIEVHPQLSATRLPCDAPVREGLDLALYGPTGEALATASFPAPVEAPRDPSPTDPLSDRQRVTLGLELARDGNPASTVLLEQAAASPGAPTDLLELTSRELLRQAVASRDAARIERAFLAYRERSPGGALDLATAAEVARAFATVGKPRRALSGVQVVMDARFKEELAAVSALNDGGLVLTGLKLLRQLVAAYPEVPSVRDARYFAASMLLERAAGDGDRLGYTRSSLRHTAAAELAAFLLLHPDAPSAPEAAAVLVEALHALGDAARERALSVGLAARYRSAPAAWGLALADARARLGAGDAAGAQRVLEAMEPPPEGEPLVYLDLGRAREALGRRDEAREAYARSGSPEAQARIARLDRSNLALPPLLSLPLTGAPRLDLDLVPGTEVSVSAVPIALELALLRDGGALDPHAIAVEGLGNRPAVVRADKAGDVPLPPMGAGAWSVVVAGPAATARTIVLRGDLEILRSGGLVVVRARSGEPVAGAELWLFDESGGATSARTDLLGSAWVGNPRGVLVRAGERWGWWEGVVDVYAPSPAPEAYRDVLQKNAAAYDELFEQAAQQEVRASGL